MATGAEIIEPAAASSMEHASGMLQQIATEFSLGELKKPHVEMHQPLQATGSTEELVITNGCKTKESVRVEYEGNGRALEGESFSESPPSAKVAAEQNEAGEARCEEADETSMHEKQPLGDVTVSEEHGHKTDEAELEVIKEEKTYRETSMEECAPIIEKEVSTLEKAAHEIESEKFDVEYTERNLGEMKDAKPSETGIECKSEDTDIFVNESEVSLHPEEATESVSVSKEVIDSVVVGEDEQGLTGQSKSVTENHKDCVPVAAEATVITEEETPSLSQVDGFLQEEAKEDKDELNLPRVQEQETFTSQPVEMETEELHEVSSCKPEEQVTEKDETPLLTETPTEDAYEAIKSAEIPVSIHPPAEEAREDKDELNLPLVEEETIASEPVEMETEELHEVSSCKPEEQVTEKDESPLLVETPTEDADEAIKSAEIPVPIHPPKEEKLPLVEEAGQLEREARDTEIPKEQVDEDCEASSTTETMAEDESKESKDEEDSIDKDHSLEQDMPLIEGEKSADVVIEEDASVLKQTQADDESKAGGSADAVVVGYPSEGKNPLLIDEAEPLNNGVNDTEAEKLNESPTSECKEQVTEENGAPMSREVQAEDISEANESKEIAILEQPSMKKEDLPLDQEDVETEELMTGSVDKLHDISSLEKVCEKEEEVAPAADEKEAEIPEPVEDTGDVVAFKDEATEASAALAEEHEVAPSAEKASPDEPLQCDGENATTVPLVCEGDIKEVKNGDEEPSTNDSTCEEAAPIEDGVGTEVKEPEIEIHARSIDIPLEDVDTKEDDTSNSDKVESDKHEEVTCDKLSAEIPENSPILLPPEEVIEANMEVADAPEDDRNIDEIPLQEEEKLKNENEQNEGGEDICVTAEMQSEEKVHNPEDEILMSNEIEDVTGQSKMDEPTVSDDCSPNQDMQAEESEKAEPLPVSSLLEKAILEESMASSENPVEDVGEDHKPVNIEVDSKPDANIIEEVIDSADTGREISYASAPSSEDHGYEAISGTKHDALQEPNESPTLDDAKKIMDRECTPNEISDVEMVEEHDEPEKVTEDEKEVKVQQDINLELSPDSKVGEEKCVEEEEVQTTREVVETQEANLQGREEKIEVETQEKESETTREVVSETEAPEISTEFKDADEQATYEEVTTSLESEKRCENDSTEEKVTSEEVHDADILTRDASVDVTDQGKEDEPKETDENSANQNIQMDDGGCEKPGDEALNNTEPLPASSETEDIILEESTASNNRDGELGEDDKPESVLVDSKPVADVIEEHDEPKKATEDEKEVKVLQDINLESSLDSEAGDEKCVDGEEVQTTREVVETQEANLQSREEKIEAEKDSETTREVALETEAPEISTGFEDADKQTSFEEVTTILGPEKQCDKTAEENDSTEEKVTSEQVRDAEILMRDASVDVSDQGKADEPNETDENSANQIIQMDDGGCEKPGGEALNNAEPLPASSETEKIVLEESTASNNPDGELREVDKTENAPADSKTGADIIEERDDIEKADANDKEVKVQDDVNTELVLVAEVREEKCSEGEPGSSKDTSKEANDEPLKCDHENSVTVPLMGESDIKEVKSGDEEPNNHDSTSEEAAPIENAVGTEVKEPEIENHARSIDMKEDGTSNLDEGKEETPELDDDVEKARESDKHEEVTCDKLLTEIPENSRILLPSEEVIEANMEAEAPEDDGKAEEIPLQEEEKLKNENEQNEGGEDICVTAEKQSEEKVHNPEDEILMSNETEDVTDQSKMDEPKFSDECSPNQNMQAEESEKAEPLPVSSLLEKAILEESMASSENPVEDVGEDHKPVNIEVDSKPDAHIIEEVIDSADIGKEISYASAPSSEDHGYEAISGTEHDTLQEPNESPAVDDADKIMDRQCMPSEISETDRHETVNETTDAAEVIEEHGEPEKATEDEKEVDVKGDVYLESSPDSEVAEGKCVEEEEVQTAREVLETQQATLRSHEETIEAETQEKDSEITREVVSGSEAPEISTEFEDADKEVTTSLEPEKQSENDSTEEKVTSEEIRDADILMGGAENVPVDSKPGGDITEEVNDSADAEISCASEPALEDQSDEVLPGTEEDTSQKPDQGLNADDANEFTDQRDDIEKADENDKEVKVQDDDNAESLLATEVREEKCLEEEGVPTSGEPEPEVEVSESVALTAPVEDEANDQSNKETGKPETEVTDTETAREVVSGTEVTELPAVFEDSNKQTSFEEATESSEPEKQCEKATGVDDPVEEKDSGEEVDAGEVKTSESESLEEREIDEVGDSNVIHANSPVEYAAIKEADSGPVSEGTEAELENVNPEEIIAGGSECETTNEDLEKEKVQEGGSDSILETEDAAEEASSNPTSQQCIPEQEAAKKEAAVRVPHDELKGSEVASEEACGSKHPESEVVDAVDGNFEEEKLELTGITGQTDEISREMAMSDSQFTESISVEETISDRSRELETQVLAPIPDVILGENETAAMVEETTEENEKGVELQEGEADKELPCAAVVTEIEEQQRNVDGDSEANEADTKEATKVEDLGQEPLKEETETAHVDASVGEEAIVTADVTGLSLEKAETIQEPTPGIQVEETVVSEDSERPNVNAVEATVDANKQCESIVERSNDEEHHGVGDVDESESMKQVIDKDDVPEVRDFSTVSTDYDEAVELAREENEEVLTDVNELSTKEAQDIPEAHGEQKVVPIEQPGTVVGVTEEENESLELSSAAGVAKEECIEKDKQIEDLGSAVNDASETRSLIFQEETVEASKEYENAVGADGVIHDDIPNEKDDIGHGKAHEGESSEDAKPTCEISSESLAVGEEGDSGIIPGEGISENEASASSVIAADADNDDGQTIVSAVVTDDVEERVEEKVSEVAETPYEESNDAATLTTEATVVKSREAEKDEAVKESDRDILTDNTLETDDIERDGIPVEEAHVPHGEADESTSIKEEVTEKACITAYEERDSISVPAENIAAKDLDEQVQVGNIEPEANTTSKSETSITDTLESGTTVDEQVCTSVEEVKEVKEVEKELPEEAEDRCEKIDREVPQISLSEAEQDQKPVEETAETETGHGREEPEEVLTTVYPSAEETAVVEEVTVKNTEVGGSELESGGVSEKIRMGTAEFVSVPEEMEETAKEVELRHGENLQSAPAPEAAEEVCSERAEEMSTEATESAYVAEEIEQTTKEVELRHDENLQSAPVPEAPEEICLEKADEISTEADESASVAKEIEETKKEVELRHDESLQSTSAPVPAEEVCSEMAEEVITKPAESVSVTEEIEETKREVELRHEENIQSVPAPESAEEACSDKVEEVTTNTAGPVSVTEEIDETATEVELRHGQNVEPAFTPEATDEVCSEKTEEMSTRAIESVSVTEEIEETAKVLEVRHGENLQSAPAEEICSENAEEMSTKAAESRLDIDTHMVSNQLEDAEIIEKHFEVANSAAEEQSEKVADEVSPVIASAEEPVYPFVEEQESRQHHTVAETSEEIHAENKLKDEEVLEEKMETLMSTVNELRNQEEKIFKVEDEPAHKEVGEINGETAQEEKVSTAISEGLDPSERSLCKTMETVIPMGKDGAATIEKPEESILGPETPCLPEHGTAEVVCTAGGKALEEPALADAADVPLSDLLKKPATETLQVTAETNKAEEAKTDEERDEHEADEDEHREHTPEHETPVMVEASKDTDVKTPQKKSHNILSGVGSKVKHSISKVKKAITGKSSHSKTASPPKQSS